MVTAQDILDSEEHRRRHGWDAAVNLITPVPRLKFPKRYLTMKAINSDWVVRKARAVGVVDAEPVEDELRRLNHLHVARWSLLRWFPRPAGAAPERGRHSLLLFTSHFDLGWRRYLGTFIETTGDGLEFLWGDIPSWRPPSEGSRAFENFVVEQQVPHRHLFAAFPELSCNDVRSALRLKAEIDACRLAGRHDDADKLALFRRLQHCVVSLPEPTYPDRRIVSAAERDPDPHGFTCLLPYDHGKQDELAEIFSGLDAGEKSPFASLPGTHFARMAMITPREFVRRSVPPLANGYLLVSAELDGHVDPWLAELAAAPQLDPIWARCHGYTDSDGLPDLLRACRIKPSVEYYDYPGATVREIADAVADARAWTDGLLPSVPSEDR